MILTREEARIRTGIEAELLDGDVRCLSSRAGDVAVELGCMQGGSAALLSLSFKEVYTIDLFEDLPESSSYSKQWIQEKGSSYLDTATRLHKFPNVKVLKQSTRIIPDEILSKPIDLLFIDADHSYEGVRADYETWLPLVRLGGTIIFHDYSYDKRDTVKKYIDQVVSFDPSVTFWSFEGVCAVFVKTI